MAANSASLINIMFNTQIIKFAFSKVTKVQKFLPKNQNQNQKKELEIAYPKQHPRKLDSKASEIISLEKSPKYIAPIQEVPSELYKQPDKPFESPIGSRFLEVAIVGAPNAGKSSLFNKIIKKELSAVSNKSHTTDKDVVGIYTNIEKKTQIVLHDTPGIARINKHSNQFITRAWKILQECDKVLLVVDAVKRLDDPLREAIYRLRNQQYSESAQAKRRLVRKMTNDPLGSEKFLQELESMVDLKTDEFDSKHIPTYLVMNKIDLCSNKRKLKESIDELEHIGKFEKIFYTSSETGYGIEDLIKDLEEEAYLGPWEHHPDLRTDMPEVRKLEELMKKVIFNRFYYEVPHSINPRVSGFTIRSDGVVRIEYTLEVFHENQIPIVIGEKGKNIKLMKDQVQVELVKAYQKEFFVHLSVRLRGSSFWLDPQTYEARGVYDENYTREQTMQEINTFKESMKQKFIEQRLKLQSSDN